MLRKHRTRRQIAELIRLAVDSCPDGICIAATDGRPILVNPAFNDACFRLLGSTVTDAASMWEALRRRAIPEPEASSLEAPAREDRILQRLEDGSVWQLRRSPLSIHGTEVFQYEAAEVTELYELRERLRERNRRAEGLHTRQRELIRSIVQNNLDEETLHAKMQIHDLLGQALLMTRNALESGTPETREIFTVWENTVTDMENAALPQERSPMTEQELIRVAGMIGCRVRFSGRQPADRRTTLLLCAAIREALTNAVRHAGADELLVDLEDRDGLCHAEISDNGTLPVRSPLREGVGLSTLRRRLESAGASLELRTDGGGVRLILDIPKEGTTWSTS